MKNSIQAKLSPQCREILECLQANNSATSYELMKLGIMSVTSRIAELRQAGFQIVCRKEKHINKHNRAVRRGRYFLISEKNFS